MFTDNDTLKKLDKNAVYWHIRHEGSSKWQYDTYIKATLENHSKGLFRDNVYDPRKGYYGVVEKYTICHGIIFEIQCDYMGSFYLGKKKSVEEFNARVEDEVKRYFPIDGEMLRNVVTDLLQS